MPCDAEDMLVAVALRIFARFHAYGGQNVVLAEDNPVR